MKKRILLLPIIGSFLLTGCKLNLFGKTIYLFENKPSQQEEKKENQEPSEEEKPKPIDDVTPEDMHKHATSLTYATNSPNAPFYLKVNEVRNIGVSLSPSPDLDEEKTVSWSIDTEGIVKYDVNESDTKKLTLTGLKAGTAKLTATNDYNQNLTYTFTIKVIDFDEENDYLWQYTSADRAQFGYVNEEGKKAGVTEGDAVLNGVTWHFTRSKATSLQSSMGAVGFGKNTEPETLIHFETDNIRTVEKFTIEAASANSLAKMTVKVGDTVFMDEVSVPRDYYDVIGTIKSADNVTPTSGKIEIDVVTPEYDAKEAAKEDYKTPGAFYLKSILINFSEETNYASEKTYDYKNMYLNETEGFYDQLPEKGKAKELTFSDDTFSVTFTKIQKASDKVSDLATTNGDIIIKPLKENEVFFKVEAVFSFGELSETGRSVYTVEKSKTDGLTYYSTGSSTSKTNGEVKVSFTEPYLNSIRLKSNNGSYIGIESLKVITIDGAHLTVKGIEVPEEFEPNKKEYLVGETFDPTGLPDLSITFVEEGINPEVLPISALEWYDAASFDADPTKASTTLTLETTEVYGVYQGEVVVTITDIVVNEVLTNVTLVKDVEDIDTSTHFFLIARTQSRLIRGSAGSDVGSSTSGTAVLESTSEDLSLSGAYKDDYFTFEIEDGKYAIKSTTGHYIGMTSSGKISKSKKPDVKFFTLTMNPETFELTMMFEYFNEEKQENYIRYIAFGTTAMSSLSTTEKANLSLYKVVS